MATLLTRIDEETYSPSNQDSEESPVKNRMGGMGQKVHSPPEPIKEEEEEEISDEQSPYNKQRELNEVDEIGEEDEEDYEEE
jgi:hypothetical protein